MKSQLDPGVILDRCQQIVSRRHDYARDWAERTGGQVMGYFCNCVPEVLLYAAGILPVRIVGSDTGAANVSAHLPDMHCSYCRGCLAEGVRGEYGYLKGVLLVNGCLYMQQAYDAWVRHLQPSFHQFIYYPHLLDHPRAQAVLVSETAELRRSLEAWLGKSITDDQIRQALEVYETNRRLLREIYELQKRKDETLSGAEAFALVLASQLMDKNEQNVILRGLLDALRKKKGKQDRRVRAMVAGGPFSSVDLFRLIESQGVHIVIDDLCTGSASFWGEAAPAPDPIIAVACDCLSRPRCAVRDLSQAVRPQHVLDLAREFQVETVLLLQPEHCFIHEYDMPTIARLLEANGIPSLLLEIDFPLAKAQLETRISAHVEMLERNQV